MISHMCVTIESMLIVIKCVPFAYHGILDSIWEYALPMLLAVYYLGNEMRDPG